MAPTCFQRSKLRLAVAVAVAATTAILILSTLATAASTSGYTSRGHFDDTTSSNKQTASQLYGLNTVQSTTTPLQFLQALFNPASFTLLPSWTFNSITQSTAPYTGLTIGTFAPGYHYFANDAPDGFLAISTGDAKAAAHQGNFDNYTTGNPANSVSGDPLLNSYCEADGTFESKPDSQQTTRNCAIFEFGLEAKVAGTLFLRYGYASEEYREYTFYPQYNDAATITVDGVEILMIPDTNQRTGIGNLNVEKNAKWYREGMGKIEYWGHTSEFFVVPNGVTFTTGQTRQFKIGVCDCSDISIDTVLYFRRAGLDICDRVAAITCPANTVLICPAEPPVATATSDCDGNLVNTRRVDSNPEILPFALSPYTVTYKVDNVLGGAQCSFQVSVPCPIVTGDLFPSATTVNVSQPVYFVVTADDACSLTQYSVDYGDGSELTVVNILSESSIDEAIGHVYVSSGIYSVTVRVQNACGNFILLTETITVNPNIPLNPIPCSECNPKPIGFWKNQCSVGSVEYASLGAYGGCAASNSPSLFAGMDTTSEVCNVLQSDDLPMCDEARQYLLALLMNLCSDRINVTCVLKTTCTFFLEQDISLLTVDEAIDFMNGVLANPAKTAFQCLQVKEMAEGINNIDLLVCTFPVDSMPIAPPVVDTSICSECIPENENFWYTSCQNVGITQDGTDLAGYIPCISLLNTFSTIATVPQACGVHDIANFGDVCDTARSYFMTLVMNSCSGRLSPSCPLSSTTVMTVGDVITYADGILSQAATSAAQCYSLVQTLQNINHNEILACDNEDTCTAQNPCKDGGTVTMVCPPDESFFCLGSPSVATASLSCTVDGEAFSVPLDVFRTDPHGSTLYASASPYVITYQVAGLYGGQSCSFDVSVSASTPQIALFVASPINQFAEAEFIFSITDQCGLASYSFDYGDSSAIVPVSQTTDMIAQSTFHAYSVAGNYVITLTATNIGNIVAAKTVNLEVLQDQCAAGADTVPTVTFKGDKNTISVAGQGSSDNKGEITFTFSMSDLCGLTQYQIDFDNGDVETFSVPPGDGSTLSYSGSLEYKYTKTGTTVDHVIRFTQFNVVGNSASATWNLKVVSN